MGSLPLGGRGTAALYVGHGGTHTPCEPQQVLIAQPKPGGQSDVLVQGWSDGGCEEMMMGACAETLPPVTVLIEPLVAVLLFWLTAVTGAAITVETFWMAPRPKNPPAVATTKLLRARRREVEVASTLVNVSNLVGSIAVSSFLNCNYSVGITVKAILSIIVFHFMEQLFHPITLDIPQKSPCEIRPTEQSQNLLLYHL